MPMAEVTSFILYTAIVWWIWHDCLDKTRENKKNKLNRMILIASCFQTRVLVPVGCRYIETINIKIYF